MAENDSNPTPPVPSAAVGGFPPITVGSEGEQALRPSDHNAQQSVTEEDVKLAETLYDEAYHYGNIAPYLECVKHLVAQHRAKAVRGAEDKLADRHRAIELLQQAVELANARTGKVEADNARLVVEAQANAIDAARYRWLLKQGWFHDCEGNHTIEFSSPPGLDTRSSAVDAAMLQEP